MDRYLIILIEGFTHCCVGDYAYLYSYSNELSDSILSDHENGYIDILDNKLGCIMTRKKQWKVLPRAGMSSF